MRTFRSTGWRKRSKAAASYEPRASSKRFLLARSPKLAVRSNLLLHPRKQPGRCVHGHSQLGGVAVRSVDYVPQERIFLPVPLQHIKNRSVGLFLQQFVSAVLLGDGQGLVRVYFEKLDVENLGAGIGRAVGVVDAVRNIAVGPGIGLGLAQRRRSESDAPLSRLAVSALGTSGFRAIRLSVLRPSARGDVALVERAASGDCLRRLWLSRLCRCRLARLGRGQI